MTSKDWTRIASENKRVTHFRQSNVKKLKKEKNKEKSVGKKATTMGGFSFFFLTSHAGLWITVQIGSLTEEPTNAVPISLLQRLENTVRVAVRILKVGPVGPLVGVSRPGSPPVT